jgi:hypothetical protein
MRLLLLIFFTLEITSCKKTQIPSTSQPKVQFYGNGHLYVMAADNLDGTWGNGPSISRATSFYQGQSKPIHYLFALQGIDTLNWIKELDLCEGDLTVGTYPTNYISATLIFNGIKYGCFCSDTTNTHYDVNITSISDSSATGNFSGVFYPFNSGPPPFVITDGSFSDIPIYLVSA